MNGFEYVALFQGQATEVILREPEEINVEKY